MFNIGDLVRWKATHTFTDIQPLWGYIEKVYPAEYEGEPSVYIVRLTTGKQAHITSGQQTNWKLVSKGRNFTNL